MKRAMSSGTRLRVVVELVAFAIVAAIAGSALGAGAATLSNEPQAGAKASATTPEPPDAAGRPTTTGATGSGGPSLRVVILSTVLHPAAGPEGQRRRRARLSVGVRVTNRRLAEITLARPHLQAGGGRVSADPNAAAAAGALLRPLAPGASARGVLRFETAGPLTDSLTTTLRASLRIGSRTIALRLKIGNRATRTA